MLDFKDIIGVGESAIILGIGESTVRNYCSTGRIRSKKVGKTWIISKDWLDRFGHLVLSGEILEDEYLFIRLYKYSDSF